jgi:hypothetical protein
MNIKWNIFRLGSIYKKLSRPINAINHPPPRPPQYAKWGWCAAMTLRQYLVCRECRKVAQHCSRLCTTNYSFVNERIHRFLPTPLTSSSFPIPSTVALCVPRFFILIKQQKKSECKNQFSFQTILWHPQSALVSCKFCKEHMEVN